MPKHRRRSRTRKQPRYLFSGTSVENSGNAFHESSSSANPQDPEENEIESLSAKPIPICSWTGRDIVLNAASLEVSPDELSRQEITSQFSYPISNFNDFSINIPNIRIDRSPTIRPLNYSFTSSTAVPEATKDITPVVPGENHTSQQGRIRTVTPVVIAGDIVGHECRFGDCNGNFVPFGHEVAHMQVFHELKR